MREGGGAESQGRDERAPRGREAQLRIRLPRVAGGREGPNAQLCVREARFAGRGPQSCGIVKRRTNVQYRVAVSNISESRQSCVRLTFVASPARPGPTCRRRRGTPLAAVDFDAFASGVTPCF